MYWHDLTCIQKQSPFTIWWILFTRQTFHLLTLNDQVIHEYTWCMCYKLIQGICFSFQIINSYENLIPSPGTVKFDAIFITSVFPSHHQIPHLSSDKNLRDPMCVFFYRCIRGLGWLMRCPCSPQVGWWASKRLRVYPKRPHESLGVTLPGPKTLNSMKYILWYCVRWTNHGIQIIWSNSPWIISCKQHCTLCRPGI